ncbi:MAG: hypothetical protein ACLP1X_19115 [Polyangiaceae bacterium]
MKEQGDRKSGITATERSFARVCLGRLVEVHVRRLGSVADVDSLKAAVFAALERAGSGAVICADCRGAAPYTAEVANACAQAMRQLNPSIARSGLLLDPSNTMFNLQIERVAQCAGHDQRRLSPMPTSYAIGWTAV